MLFLVKCCFLLKKQFMKNTYLILALLGFLLPNALVLLESIETGNILLYAKPLDTINAMFVNRISTIFAIDLLFTVLVFFGWSYQESKQYGIRQVYGIWLLTLLFGLAGGFPLFLYLREKAIAK